MKNGRFTRGNTCGKGAGKGSRERRHGKSGRRGDCQIKVQSRFPLGWGKGLAKICTLGGGTSVAEERLSEQGKTRPQRGGGATCAGSGKGGHQHTTLELGNEKEGLTTEKRRWEKTAGGVVLHLEEDTPEYPVYLWRGHTPI